MNINVGDLFIVKGRDVDDFDVSFIITEDHKIHYQVVMYYPDGNIKHQTLEADVIKHYVENEEFIHYPVIE
jgi:hypothetical protein